MIRGSFDHDLVQCASLALFTLFIISQPVVADQLSPVTEFTVRDGIMIDSDPFGFFGYIQESPDLVDETFIEFDLASLSAANAVDLELKTIRWPAALTFDVSTYHGSGDPSVAPFGTGSILTTLSLDPFQYEHTYTIDLTSRVAAAIADGYAFLGIRLHDPAGIPPGSDQYPFVLYESANLLYTVPEPSMFVLIGTGVAGLLVRGRRKRLAAP